MATKSGVADKPILVNFISDADYRKSTDSDVYLIQTQGAADGSVVEANAGELCIGIRQDSPYTGDAMSVAIGGISLLKIGSGGITRGAKIKSDNDGQGVASTADRENIVGIALASGSEGDLVPVLVRPGPTSNA